MKLHFMSWLRTRAGRSNDVVNPPENVTTIESLVNWLTSQEARYEALFTYRSIISVAVNGEMKSDWQAVLKSDDEITFFSPLAGG